MFEELCKELYVDFDESMGKDTGYFRIVENLKGNPLTAYITLKNLYEKNNLLKVTPQVVPRIPKIIHQIWIGARPIPPLCEEYRQSWIKHHPDWEYRLWTDKEVANYQFINKDLEFLFHKSKHIGEKVDLLRYDILYRMGGLYVDVDCMCFRPFDILHHCYDFYIGILNPVPQEQFFDGALTVCNAAMGAKPGHPFFKRLGELIRGRWDESRIPGDAIYTTIHRTYLALTPAFLSVIGENGNLDIALPASYFYPIFPVKALDFSIRGFKEVFSDRLHNRPGPFSTPRPHSFMHHDSQKLWFADCYAEISFRGKMWLGFKFKDWVDWAKTKFGKK